jgi:hypothetical protein
MRSGAPGGLFGRALACLLAVAGVTALTTPARAVAVDISDALRLSAQGGSAICQGVVCPTPYGNVTVTGDTTTSLTYTVTLAPGVSFLGAGHVFYFDLTNGAGTISFSSVGSGFSGPVPGSYGPLNRLILGPYDYAVTCTEALCSGPLTFTATTSSSSDPFVIGSPLGGGPFARMVVPFVANLSVLPDTPGLCPLGETPCTGLVGAPEPSTWGMMLIAFAGLGFVGYRRARASQRRLPAA